MEKKKSKGKGHGHPWTVGILGIIVAIAIYIHLPMLKMVSGFIFLFALAHVIIALVLLISAYLISPKKLLYNLFEKIKLKKMEGEYYFGWSFGWMNMFWIGGLAFVLASVWIYIYDPSLIWLSLILFLISLNLFAGNFTLRTSKNNDYMTLPFVDLLSKENNLILDAGCGSGRTTLALVKVMKNGKIISFDRFDSDYIENGGKTLIERNIRIAGIANKVELAEGDITEMKFSENTFDAAISSYMMDHLGKYKLDGLKEIYRTLKPGGRFLLIVFVPCYATFSVFNVMCFSLTTRKGWKELFNQTNFKLIDEGVINSGVFFLIEKPLK
jgi:ubiquinone/menaquinone biosynthesis C-methylase UbiE